MSFHRLSYQHKKPFEHIKYLPISHSNVQHEYFAPRCNYLRRENKKNVGDFNGMYARHPAKIRSPLTNEIIEKEFLMMFTWVTSHTYAIIRIEA